MSSFATNGSTTGSSGSYSTSTSSAASSATSREVGDDAGDFLILVERLADREHHLLVVTVEGREPAELRGVEVFAGDDGLDARHRQRRASCRCS